MKFVGDSRIPAERKPNIPKDYSEFPGKTEAFWPNFLLKEWMVGAVFLVGFLVLTIVHEPPLERMADPTDTGYIPLPDKLHPFSPLHAIPSFSIESLVYSGPEIPCLRIMIKCAAISPNRAAGRKKTCMAKKRVNVDVDALFCHTRLFPASRSVRTDGCTLYHDSQARNFWAAVNERLN